MKDFGETARHGMMRRYSMFLAMAALPLLGGCGEDEEEPPPRAAIVDPDGPLKLSLMTFNVRYENPAEKDERAWSRRMVKIVGMVRNLAPDIMGVQELEHGQAADLRVSLPDYGFTGSGRDDGGRKGEYAGIFFRRDRFLPDPGDAGTFWFSDTPAVPGSHHWGNTLPRIATWVRLTDVSTGRGVYVFNTHFDHKHEGSRERAALLLAERIDGRRRKEDPVVLLGDFNSNDARPPVMYLGGKKTTLAGKERTWKAPLTETYNRLNARVTDRRTLHFWEGSWKGSLKVDHIFVSGGARVLAAEIQHDGTPYASDHFAVTAKVVFPGSASRGP